MEQKCQNFKRITVLRIFGNAYYLETMANLNSSTFCKPID